MVDGKTSRNNSYHLIFDLEKVKDILIFKNLQGEYKSVSDYFGEEVGEAETKEGVLPKVIYYVSDEIQQAQYIEMFKDELLK